jgi:hypothetical protein
MTSTPNIFTQRKTLNEICRVPAKIISVYSLEQHVWHDNNSETARREREPELQTIDEFQIEPVRPFLNDILRQMAAPYNPDRRENPIGQGYWIQAEFGSGKSHLLCFLSALALGSSKAWDIIKKKEQHAQRGKRESIYHFWEEGLESKAKTKGIFTVVKTLVGAGSSTVGLADKGRQLTEYILDSVKDQLLAETGKNLSLYPAELLADRFLQQDLERYRRDLAKFLKDPNYFDEDEFEDLNDFIRDIQQSQSLEYKRSCGNKLWRFYTEYLKVQPHIAADTEEILKHMVQTILNEGYCGILLVLDEVSLFMKNRDDAQRTEDEKTLVVLSNRLAKVHNLPIWTVCAAQQAIESKMGVKNIIADDRLKVVKLLENPKDYYEIVLNRVRSITNEADIAAYYLHYKRGFSWPASIGEAEFTTFFPFHKPALEVLRQITFELTTTRSAIHFMHQTLKHQIKHKGNQLIRLWELFDETVRYEEDPSGVHAGIVSIQTTREPDYKAYESCVQQIDSITKGTLKIFRDRAIKIVQTLFLFHIARMRQQGLPPEEVANNVLIERDDDANVEENIQHYENISEHLKKELRQIVQTFDDDRKPRYRFDPVRTGVDPRDEFRKARDEAEVNELMQREAWDHLVALDEWPVKTRQMTMYLDNGVKSIFCDIAPFIAPWEDPSSAKAGDKELELIWQGRQLFGLVGMRDFSRFSIDQGRIPQIETDETDRDFAIYVCTRSLKPDQVQKILGSHNDPRVMVWTPAELRSDENDRLLDFAAYRKLVSEWQGKDTEDAVAIINWVSDSLSKDLGTIYKIVSDSYSRGRIDALNNTQMDFKLIGELETIAQPLVERILAAVYESRDIRFEHPFIFKREDAVKVINGIVKVGEIPKGAKPNQNISAAQNFGPGLKITKRANDKKLDCSGNDYIQALWNFIDQNLVDDSQVMDIRTIYKNFTGVGGPKDYGLSRRMLQIYLLCLTREGKIKINLSTKSNHPYPHIDYSNIGDIDFSATLLNSLTTIQKMARPQNWEVLRPYAEKLLCQPIPSTHDDTIIANFRAALRNLFAVEGDESCRILANAKVFFDTIGQKNPYEDDLVKVSNLFSTDLASGSDDIALMLYGLKNAFGYQAFTTEMPHQDEVDDLAIVLKNYRNIQHLLTYQREIQTAYQYCTHQIASSRDFDHIIKLQAAIKTKIDDLSPYIDSDVKLKTELVGHNPPEPGETTTLGCLIHEYSSLYSTFHNNTLNRTDECLNTIDRIINGTEMSLLRKLEQITALQPVIANELASQLSSKAKLVFRCSSPSHASVQEKLKSSPQHSCGLTFANADEHLKEATQLAEQSRQLFDTALQRKLSVLLNQAVQQRLQQGQQDRDIQPILNAKTTDELREQLTKCLLADDSLIHKINKYLKRVSVKNVRLANFKPSKNTIEKDQIGQLVREFEQYINKEFESIETNDDTLPVIQID